jgi:hypothetical protein
MFALSLVQTWSRCDNKLRANKCQRAAVSVDRAVVKHRPRDGEDKTEWTTVFVVAKRVVDDGHSCKTTGQIYNNINVFLFCQILFFICTGRDMRTLRMSDRSERYVVHVKRQERWRGQTGLWCLQGSRQPCLS